MCAQWHNNKEELLDKLKDEWDKNNNQHSDIPYVLNTDIKKFNEPYFYDIYEDDIYYDENDEHNKSIVNPNNMEKPSNVQMQLDVRNKERVKENFPISDIWST
ncbi:erythrocyte membrane protein 1 (PfEMP1), exon 2, putative [Plasmodium sp. DRC-Itaito]|nr:erythrocyte membrane protein 1 (PfEMP1), exon 2, putative [Plasmodium sp. DRC-Itaito]